MVSFGTPAWQDSVVRSKPGTFASYSLVNPAELRIQGVGDISLHIHWIILGVVDSALLIDG